MSPQFTPTVDPTGGSQFGNSYITAWVNCPRDWYNLFKRPTLGPTGELLGTGLTAGSTSIHLLLGRVFHDGIAAWYESGVRDGTDTGERSIDQAMEAALATFKSVENDFEKPEMADESWTRNEVMLRAYHDRYGPESHSPEFPTVQVMCDAEGLPLVEREWKAQLSPGYVYTCRTDLIITHHGLLKTMEHKTTSPYGVRARRTEMDMDSQFSGEYWILRECMPEMVLAGVLVNMVVKDRSANSKFDVAERETTIRTSEQLDRWQISCVHALRGIDQACEAYDKLVEEGMEHSRAADYCFPDYGARTKQCYAYGGRCQYLDLCQQAGHEERVLPGYTTRFKVEQGTANQETQGS